MPTVYLATSLKLDCTFVQLMWLALVFNAPPNVCLLIVIGHSVLGDLLQDYVAWEPMRMNLKYNLFVIIMPTVFLCN